MAEEPDAPRASGPPPRPAMASFGPPPIQAAPTTAGAVRTSRTLWLTSFVVGLIALALAFFDRQEQIEHLGAMVDDRGLATGAADALPAVVFWGSIVAAVLVVVLEALALRAMLRRRRGARPALLVLLLVQLVVAVVAAAFLAAPDQDGTVVRGLLAGQGVLAAAAWVCGVLPGANAWFRAQRPREGVRG